MSVQVEKLEKNMAKLTIEVSAEEFEKALQAAYLKQRGSISVQGFRKGKVPRQMIEKMYGPAIFYEEAVNSCIPGAYADAAAECGLEIVSQPEIDVVQVEKGKSFIFTAEVAVKPEVTLGDYKGIEVVKAEVEVSDEEVAAELEKVRKQNARTITVEDRAVESGDTVTIDFEGFVDGVAFEGGKGTDYPLTIGSHSFIDTFEDQLIGHNIGDDVKVNVTFPEQYQAADLAGKPAVFEVKVKAIKAEELPEVDDDFAQDVSEFDTLEEYKADLAKGLAEKKEKDAKNAMEDEAIEKVIANAQMDIPEKMIEAQQQRMIEDFAANLQQQGLSMEQYMQFTGLNQAMLMEQVKPQAEKRIQSRLVLEAIAKAEAIEVADAEVDAELEKMASMYKMELETVKGYMGEEGIAQMKEDIAVQKAVEVVMANVVVK
ncbi:MAG: trigger factor [Lachnospiraceae bacterium]|nr:trigger factor [Lachnospiraceae bacterium]